MLAAILFSLWIYSIELLVFAVIDCTNAYAVPVCFREHVTDTVAGCVDALSVDFVALNEDVY